MKKTLLLIALVLCCATTIFAQNNKISYQAVVRDTENKLVANKDVTVTVKIFDGDVQQPAYTQTYENVHTNLNGLISLLIGPAQPNEAWNSIQWNQARIETTVTLDNTSLGTLKMPLTAVPYALYAKEISPDAVVVTEIYNKMFVDSNALAGQITNLDSKLTSKIHEDSVALAGQITTLNTNLTNEINNLKAADNALSTRIKADSANLKNNYYIKSDINTKFADTAKYALKSSLAEVAFNGSYNSLNNKPAINNATLTIKQGETSLGTFTANASQDVTITVPPAQVQSDWNQSTTTAVDYIKNKPTNLSQFTNDAGYLKCDDDCIGTLQNRITALEQQLAYIISQFSPVVTTANVSSIAATTASCGGNVTNDGGKPVTARGVCWSTSENPTTSNSKTTNGTGTGSFTSSLSNLNPNTSYNVRAYATNSVGTAYGENRTFTTLATVTTSDVSNVTGNSATCGGSFPTANGSANITARGVCWSTSQNPTTSDSKTTNGTGTGSFTSNITGLSQGTTYYVRAYATNSTGTTYGEQKTFTTTSVEVNSSFQYCYDVQRGPAYPKANQSASISGFNNPLVDEQGVTGSGHTTSSQGPWKVEYVGVYSSTNQYGFTDSQINYLKGKYGMTSTASVPIFLLKKEINGQYVGLVHGVVCAYSKTTNTTDHTALFIAPRENNNDGWGFYLTGQSHSGSISVTFDEDLSGGLNSLIPNNTLSFITVSKGSSNFTSDHRLYYTPGETYSQALSNHPDQNAGWDTWEGNIGSVLWNTLFYEEGDNGKDLYIDGDSNFAPGAGSCSLTFDSQIDPTGHTFVFSGQQP